MNLACRDDRRPRSTVVKVVHVDSDEQRLDVRRRLSHGLSISSSIRIAELPDSPSANLGAEGRIISDVSPNRVRSPRGGPAAADSPPACPLWTAAPTDHGQGIGKGTAPGPLPRVRRHGPAQGIMRERDLKFQPLGISFGLRRHSNLSEEHYQHGNETSFELPVNRMMPRLSDYLGDEFSEVLRVDSIPVFGELLQTGRRSDAVGE